MERVNRTFSIITALIAAIAIGVTCRPPLGPISKAVLVGALEEVPGHFANEPTARKVRVLFHKSGGAWEAYKSDCPDQDCLKQAAASFPRAVTWTVTYNGRNLGVVDAETPDAFDAYSDIGLQTIAAGARAPTVGERSSDYAGFLDQAVYRPLVTVSNPESRDPDGWTQTVVSEPVVAVLRQAFRARFPSVENCATPEENTPRRWAYFEGDIHVGDAHASNTRWTLATLSLSDYRCDGPPDGPYVDQLFSVDPAGHVALIGDEMRYLDAGDYDGDGRSEVVVSIARYNRGGYALFFDTLGRHVTFEFSYH